jgi:hypothetical protein
MSFVPGTSDNDGCNCRARAAGREVDGDRTGSAARRRADVCIQSSASCKWREVVGVVGWRNEWSHNLRHAPGIVDLRGKYVRGLSSVGSIGVVVVVVSGVINLERGGSRRLGRGHVLSSDDKRGDVGKSPTVAVNIIGPRLRCALAGGKKSAWAERLWFIALVTALDAGFRQT